MMKALTASLIAASACFAFAQDVPSKVAENPMIGHWERDAGGSMWMQTFQNGRFFNAHIDKASKVISNFACGDLVFFPAVQDHRALFAFQNKYATADWHHHVGAGGGKGTPVTFTEETQTREHGEKTPPKLEEWTRQKIASEPTALDGVWQKDAGMNLVEIKAFWRGKVCTAFVDTRSGRVKGASLGTFTMDFGKLIETVTYASQEWRPRIGKTIESGVVDAAGKIVVTDKRGMTQEWSKLPDFTFKGGPPRNRRK